MCDQHSLIDPTARLGKDCSIASFAVLHGGVTLSDRVTVDHHAVLGGLPQDLAFDPTTPTGVEVGEGTVIREGVTIHRATKPGLATIVGAHCFLMANSHLGHDVRLGDHVTLANGVLLGGHVQVEDHCFLGGGALFHQHIRIGEGAMVKGGSAITYDIPPFVVASNANRVRGLNMVGLKRREFSQVVIGDLKACYKAVYFRAGNPASKAKGALEADLPQTAQGRKFLHFFESSQRGFIRSANERSASS